MGKNYSDYNSSFLCGLGDGQLQCEYLENGTKKMAARPFVDKIKEKATPEIEKIYKEPYG